MCTHISSIILQPSNTDGPSYPSKDIVSRPVCVCVCVCVCAHCVQVCVRLGHHYSADPVQITWSPGQCQRRGLPQQGTHQ